MNFPSLIQSRRICYNYSIHNIEVIYNEIDFVLLVNNFLTHSQSRRILIFTTTKSHLVPF
jgi:hypothetical protein